MAVSLQIALLQYTHVNSCSLWIMHVLYSRNVNFAPLLVQVHDSFII